MTNDNYTDGIDDFADVPTFDQVMERSLADFCNTLIKKKYTKKNAIKWCCDHFDEKGKYYVPRHYTGQRGKRVNTTVIEDIYLTPNTILGIDHIRAFVFAMDKLSECAADNLDVQSLKNVLAETLKYNAFMIWKMCNMHTDIYGIVHEDDDLQPVAYGMFVNISKNKGDDDETLKEKTEGCAVMIPCKIITEMLEQGTMDIVGVAL